MKRFKDTLFYNLLNLRNETLSKCKKIYMNAEKLRQSKVLTDEEFKNMTVAKKNISSISLSLKNIGRSMPQYFNGDLLDLKNYVNAYNYFFAEQHERERIADGFVKNYSNSTFEKLVEEHILDLYTDEELSNFDECELTSARKLSTLDVICNKVSDLDSTKAIYNKVESACHQINEIDAKVTSLNIKYFGKNL